MWTVRVWWNPDDYQIIATTRWRWWALIRTAWFDWWTPSSYWPIVVVEPFSRMMRQSRLPKLKSNESISPRR